MGGAKQHQIEEFERGVSNRFKTFVCHRHIEDRGIEEYIKINSATGKCNYCLEDDLFDEEDANEVIPLVELVSHIVDCLRMEYDEPANWLAFETAESGYQGEVYDTDELLQDMGIHTDNEVLFENIVDSILIDQWCDSDPYGLKESDSLFFTWKNFKEILMHRSRFVFFKNTFKGSEDSMEPYEILDKLGEVVFGMKNLYNTFDSSPLFPTIDFYRARQHEFENDAKAASSLGSPPKELAVVNRMSPAGIPMFYCADTEETAIAEIKDEKDLTKKFITVGCFQNKRPLNIINLNHLNRLSLFELDKNEYYHAVQFLWRFREEISKPVSRNGSEHFEYVPTQVVTEYFRDVFPQKYKIKVDGIQYPSVKKPGTSCFVLFFDQYDIIDKTLPKGHVPPKKYLGYSPLIKKAPSLILLNKTIKTFNWTLIK